MYGFIEKWLADIIGVPYEYYTLNDESQAAILVRSDFENVRAAIHDLWLTASDVIELEPRTINSDVLGTKVLFHKYWVNDNILHGLTNAETKNMSNYIYLVNEQQPRFNVEQFKIDIVDSYNYRATGTPINDRTAITIDTSDVEMVIDNNEEEATQVDPATTINEDPKITTKLNAGEEYIKEVLKRMPDSFVRDCPVSPEKEKKVLFALGEYGSDYTNILELADDINKNIIVVTRSLGSSFLSSIKRIQKFSKVAEHTVFLLLRPKPETGFSLVSGAQHNASVCFGKEILSLHLIKNFTKDTAKSNILNDESLNREEKEKRLKGLLERPELSVYSKFDSVFKDTKTNVVWALRDRCFIHMTFELTNNSAAFSVCLKELGRRFSGEISRKRMLEIDSEYHKEIADNNKIKYVKFAIDNSQSLIKTLEAKFKEEKKLYTEYLDKAMEHGKLMKKYADYIQSFDPEKSEKEEREKAIKAYEETEQIPGVLSVNIKDDFISVYTKNLYAQDERSKKWHDIGTFHIKIGILSNTYSQDNTVRILNTKHQIHGMNSGMQAPHVFAEGTICHGSLARGMVESYKNRDLFQLTYQLILFLQQANTDDAAGMYVNKWPEVSSEIANNGFGVEEEEEEVEMAPTEEELAFDNMLVEAIPVNV